MILTKMIRIFFFFLLNCSINISAQYNWFQLENFSGSARYGSINFVIGDTAYVGLGKDGSGYFSDFYKYNPSSDTWTKIADFGGNARAYAVAFTINNKGYVTTGENGSTRYKDLWEYDPTSNQWTQKADFCGTARTKAVGFAIGNKGYLGTGNDGAEKKDFWEYDPGNNIWTQKAALASDARQQAIGFAVNGRGYICAGATYSNGTFMTNNNYEYNPATNTWTEKSFAESFLSRTDAASFVMNNKAYICGGFGKNDFWEYNPANNSWNKLADFGPSRETNRISATGFSINGKGYIALGEYMVDFSTTEIKNDVWKYSLPDPPKAPVNLRITDFTHYYIALSWENENTEETTFIIERSTGNNLDFKPIESFLSTFSIINYYDYTYSDSTLYYYRVQSKNTSGYSGYSNEISGYTRIGKPTSLFAIPKSTKEIKLFWTDNSMIEEKYFIERSKNNNLNFVVIDSVPAGTESWSDNTLTAGEKCFYRVYMTYKDKKIYSNENYAITGEQGSWKYLGGFYEFYNTLRFTFTFGHKIYIETCSSSDFLQSFWEYNTQTGIWTKKADFPGNGKYGLSAFVIDGKGYAGLGKDDLSSYKDLWEYDPMNDTWTRKADFPGSARSFAPGLTIGNFGYIGLGLDNASNNLSDFWQYDHFNDQWTRKADFPIEISPALIGFSIKGKGFIGFSSDNSSFFSYDPSSDTWEQKNEFNDWKAENDGHGNIRTFTINNEAYIFFQKRNSFWKYDSINDSWVRKNGLSDFFWPCGNNFVAASCEGKAYIICYCWNAAGGNEYPQSFYCYNPEGPANPSDLTIADYSTESISLKWKDNSNNEEKFILERRSDTDWKVIDSTLANQCFYIDTNVTQNFIYRYRIYAKNDTYISGYSNEVVVKIGAPEKPSFTSVISKYNENKVYINFSTVDFSEGYIIERSDFLEPEKYLVIGTFNNAYETIVDCNLISDHWYNYRIKAYNKTGSSSYSDVVKIITGSVSMYSGTLSTDNAILFDENGYNLKHKDNTQNILTIFPQTPGNIITLQLLELSLDYGDILYIFDGIDTTSRLIRKFSITEVWDSLIYSKNQDGALTLFFNGNRIYNDYTGFLIDVKSCEVNNFPPSRLKSMNTFEEIRLKWIDNSDNEDYFIIERSVNNNHNFVKIDSVGANITTYTDSDVNSYNKYFYRVNSKINGKYSAYSNTILTVLKPAAPSDINFSVTNSNDIVMSWRDNSDNEESFTTGYYKYDYFFNSNYYYYKNTLPPNTTSDTISDVDLENLYNFYIIANNMEGKSDTVIKPAMILIAPQDIEGNYFENRNHLKWKNNSPNTQTIVIERSEDLTNFIVIETFDVEHRYPSYSDNLISESTDYYYRIKGIHQYGESTYSDTVKITTGKFSNINNTPTDIGISVYPNPTNGIFYMKDLPDKICSITIYNVLGNECKTISKGFIHGDNKIDISDLASGVYYIKINFEENSITKKIIKKD